MLHTETTECQHSLSVIAELLVINLVISVRKGKMNVTEVDTSVQTVPGLRICVPEELTEYEDNPSKNLDHADIPHIICL